MTQAASQPDPYVRVVKRFSLAAKLEAAGDMLDWDATSTCPRAAPGRARASLVDFATLVQEATGAPLGTEAYKRHIKRRYLEEPGL